MSTTNVTMPTTAQARSPAARFAEQRSVPLPEYDIRNVAPSTQISSTPSAAAASVQKQYNAPRYAPVKAPTPVAPTQVAPTPVAPTPVAPTPVAPAPVVSTTAVPPKPKFAPMQITVPLRQATPVYAAVQAPTPPSASQFTSSTQQSIARAELPIKAPPKSLFRDQIDGKKPEYTAVKRTLS